MSDLKQLTILLVEDEDELRHETAAFLELHYARIYQAGNGREALKLFEQKHPDLIISDIRMPVMDGLELAAKLKTLSPDTPFIFCTAFSETVYLLKAIELGVAAFIRKPVDTDQMLDIIAKTAIPILQRREIMELSEELVNSIAVQLGGGKAQQAVATQVARVAHSSFNILLQGETGTGKSRLAGIIHSLSQRRKGPLVTVQLGAIPEQLVESELFGHIKGSFTGADRTRTGLIETAAGGTLFLDDIETAPAGVQAKLLRCVEEKRYTPVGSSSEKTADVRIISSSNCNLKGLAKNRLFREDLYYRLADFTLRLPPLREIPESILPMALTFLSDTCAELGRELPPLDDNAASQLTKMPWPGNIRQLKSVIRQAALYAKETVTISDLAADTDHHEHSPLISDLSHRPAPPPFPCEMDKLEKWSLEQALLYCGGKRMKTAAMLGMNYYTFRRHLEKHGIAASD
ncbi:MAG: sigma-54-dependent Fis family transcriptional regulator [Geobacteraceae bacterium]|nr:sigma-54-dependent Fis family transcriptional regulator [Geobacteraceae bacterium]